MNFITFQVLILKPLVAEFITESLTCTSSTVGFFSPLAPRLPILLKLTKYGMHVRCHT